MRARSGSNRAIDVRRRRQSEGHAAPGDVHVRHPGGDRHVGSPRGAGVERNRAFLAVRGEPDPRRAVEPPATEPTGAGERASRRLPGRVRGLRPGSPVVRRPDPRERVDPHPAFAHRGLAHEPAQESQVRRQPEHDGSVERRRQAIEGLGAVRAVGDDLGQHRVEPGPDDRAFIDPGVDADPGADRPDEPFDPTRRRQEVVLGILGVQPHLDGVAAAFERGIDLHLGQVERPTLGDPELLLDEVEAGHRLRHRVLDLEARVHLEEEHLASIGQEELARPGAPVAHGAGELERGAGKPLADRRRDGRRRCLLEHLLMAPLRGAVAFAQVDASAGAVEEHLHLDVARSLDEPFEDHAAVVESGRGLAPGALERGLQLRGNPNGPHALATAAGRRLHEERVADRRCRARQRGVALLVAVVAGHDRDAELRREPSCRALVTHRSNRARRRPDPRDARSLDCLREGRVLRQESEPGVQRVRAGGHGSGDNRPDVEEVDRSGAIGLRLDDGDAKALGGAPNATDDLAAVRDEEPADAIGSRRRRCQCTLTLSACRERV